MVEVGRGLWVPELKTFEIWIPERTNQKDLGADQRGGCLKISFFSLLFVMMLSRLGI